MRFVTLCTVVIAGTLTAQLARSQEAKPAVTATAVPGGPSAAPAGPPPPPYSLPWQLRPITVGNVIRSDTSIAFYERPNGAGGPMESGSTVATMLLGTYKLTPNFAPLVRVALVQNSAPEVMNGPPSGTAFVNPIVGATYAQSVGVLKWAAFGAVTVPVGMGGGDTPDKGAAEAAARGIPARSAMDNAMFAVNYFTGIAGLGLGYVGKGFTAQVESTLLQLFRVRGPETQDARRTNFTAGLHLGYAPLQVLSFGGELRYQRWLSDAAPVKADKTARDTVTMAIGPRLHFKINGKNWIRPGLSYGRALDAPVKKASYHIVQLDVPFVF
jgi:hypothetical protein